MEANSYYQYVRPPEPNFETLWDRQALRVAHIVDGKTLHLSRALHGAATSTSVLVVRLRGIDAPELAQPGGHAARRYLESVAPLGARALVWSSDGALDRHGRTIAFVRVERTRPGSSDSDESDASDSDDGGGGSTSSDISRDSGAFLRCRGTADGWILLQEAMLRSGNAYHYTRYSQSRDYARFEREARLERRGLWRLAYGGGDGGGDSDGSDDGDAMVLDGGLPPHARAPRMAAFAIPVNERELPWDFRQRMRDMRLRARSPPRLRRESASVYSRDSNRLDHLASAQSRMSARADSIAVTARRNAATAPRDAPHVELFW